MLWDPLRYLESCPSSDGAAAMVLGSERTPAARRRLPPAWIHGTAMRSEPHHVRRAGPGEPPGRPGLRGRRLPPGRASPTPRADSTWPRSTCPSAGTSRCGSRTSGFCAEGDGWKLTQAGATAMSTGGHPVELLGRRAVVQPDRRLGDAALPGGGHAGAGPGRRAPGRRTPGGPSARPTVVAPSSSPCGSSGADKP